MATKFERMGAKTLKFIDTQKKKLKPAPTKQGPNASKTARKNVKHG